MSSSVIGLRKDSGGRLAVMKVARPEPVTSGELTLKEPGQLHVYKRFLDFWDLMETVKKHGYLRAAMSMVGRSAVGAWWSLRKHPEYKGVPPELHRRKLMDFYNMRYRDWDNIKDFQSIAQKMMIGVMYLRFFGQVGYHILRDASGRAVGLDHLPGLIVPNVDNTGKFKTPAFVQFVSKDPRERVEFDDPRDIVYITNPDWEGSPLGGSDIESLTNLTLVLDLYLQTAAREYMKNRDKPEVVYELAPDISDEAFEAFVKEMEERYAGVNNLGRNPIAVQGEFKVHELRDLPSSLPYQESRKETREEELAVAGVSGAKLGLSDSMSNANLKENRREFHESTMVYLFRLFEMAFYEQIHLREFGYDGWEVKFNNPDFLNAVERATVHMRYRQQGVLNANEIRYELGKEPRTDEFGDEYVLPQGSPSLDAQGSPPEGREDRPDAPSETGEPTLDDQDPPRGDQHDDTSREDMLKELRQWRTFAVRRAEKGRTIREFHSEYIPEDIQASIQAIVQRESEPENLKRLFDDVINIVARA